MTLSPEFRIPGIQEASSLSLRQKLGQSVERGGCRGEDRISDDLFLIVNVKRLVSLASFCYYGFLASLWISMLGFPDTILNLWAENLTHISLDIRMQ